MTIIDANIETLLYEPNKRAGYSFKKLASKIIRTDNNDPLVDQTEIEASGLICKPFWNTIGDLEGDCYVNYIKDNPHFSLCVRFTVLNKLIEAQKLLPPNWKLVLKAGYRPLTVQYLILKKLVETTKLANPDWSGDAINNHVKKYISDPKLVCPPHSTGGAVDIDILDISKIIMIDMGCPPNTDSKIAYIFYDKLTKTQKDNRLIVLNAMLKAGFAPLASEWWHFQYGETYWAAFYGHPITKYDTIKL